MKIILIITIVFTFFACVSKSTQTQVVSAKSQTVVSDTLPKIVKAEEAWKAILTAEEYYVLREKGTERPWTGNLLSNKQKGTYTCKACALPLFASDTKFESGTGWPSFYDVIAQGNVGVSEDIAYGMVRTEVVCGRCGGHLGHVFEDGPKPTGLRYCINSVALGFVKAE